MVVYHKRMVLGKPSERDTGTGTGLGRSCAVVITREQGQSFPRGAIKEWYRGMLSLNWKTSQDPLECTGVCYRT